MHRRTVGSTLVLGACLTILLFAPLAAQDVTEPALKAAYISNFLRFTEWPDPLAPGEPYVICVRGDDAVREALARDVKNRQVSAHHIVVPPGEPAPNQTCHVLYLGG